MRISLDIFSGRVDRFFQREFDIFVPSLTLDAWSDGRYDSAGFLATDDSAIGIIAGQPSTI